MNTAIIKHSLATIQVSAQREMLSEIKRVVKLALDNYAQEKLVAAEQIHTETKKRNGIEYQSPGYYLRVYRTRADLTQDQLADELDIKQHHLSEMEHNKRSIGKALAKKIAEVLHCDYRQLL